MSMITKRYLPDGSTRSVWSDSQKIRERRYGSRIFRGSNIEVIESGARAGLFHVDFTPLAVATGNDSYRCCLLRTFDGRSEAERHEIAWLNRFYVLA